MVTLHLRLLEVVGGRMSGLKFRSHDERFNDHSRQRVSCYSFVRSELSSLRRVENEVKSWSLKSDMIALVFVTSELSCLHQRNSLDSACWQSAFRTRYTGCTTV